MPGSIAILLTNAPNNTTGSTVTLSPVPQTDKMLVQANYPASVTGNVVIQGRTSSRMPWVTLNTFTTNGGAEVPAYPEVRATTNTIAGGVSTVSAEVCWR